MDVQELVKIAIQVATAIGTVGVFVVGLIGLRRKKGADDPMERATVHSNTEFPVIHSTSGIPTLQQLTRNIEVDPRDRRQARALYDIGHEQYTYYINNRERVVVESRERMKALKDQLTESEVTLAENVGVALAESDGPRRRQTERQFEELNPQSRIYAQHKRLEYEAHASIARDLETNVPRTDYHSVRSLIESGGVTLDAIMSELPYPWQLLRTLNETDTAAPPVIKPPRREFIHLMVFNEDNTYFEDRRAERFGKWIHSRKYKLFVPYKAPTPILEPRHFSFSRGPSGPSVPTGEYITIIHEPLGSEWLTENWRQGGLIDQRLQLAREGMLPEQLRRAFWRRMLSTGGIGVAVAVGAVDILLFVQWYVL